MYAITPRYWSNSESKISARGAASGSPLGGGGRYDDLLGRFGRDLPAAGWALNVERLHIALVGERRGERL